MKISKEQLKRMLLMAHCDGKHGFDLDIPTYMGILE